VILVHQSEASFIMIELMFISDMIELRFISDMIELTFISDLWTSRELIGFFHHGTSQ
jgi:hypothetical protein